MKTLSLDTIFSTYYPGAALLEYDSNENLPTLAKLWEREEEHRDSLLGVINILTEEYLENDLSFRQPIHLGYDEKVGKTTIADGVSRVLAVKTLVDIGRIRPEQAVLKAVESPTTEAIEESEPVSSKAAGKNILISQPDSDYSLFKLVFKISAKTEGNEFNIHSLIMDDDSLFDSVSFFKINDTMWATAETAFTFTDNETRTLESLHTVDFNAITVNDDTIDNFYYDTISSLIPIVAEFEKSYDLDISYSFSDTSDFLAEEGFLTAEN